MISNDNFNNSADNVGLGSGPDSSFGNGYGSLTPIPLLQSVRVASPCNAVWEDMQTVEGERVHFCMGCQKNVYNLSAMSQNEAEGLLRRHEGRLCVRYYQRHDGTVLTGDCPIGARAVGMGLIRRSAIAAGLFAMLFGAMAAMNSAQQQTPVPAPAIAGGVSIVPPVPTPVAPDPAMQGEIMPVPKPKWVTGGKSLPNIYYPTMGIVSRPRHMETTLPPTPETENLPNAEPGRDNTNVPSEPDTTDAALLNPR